jgi:hypothetical protein
MKPGGLAALSILVLILGAFIFFIEHPAGNFFEREIRAQRLIQLEQDTVRRIEIERESGSFAAFRAEDGRWMLDAPEPEYAEAERILRLLAGLESLTRQATVTVEEMTARDGRWSDYGLDPPAARIRLSGAGPSLHLDVGSLSPTRDGVYVRVSGSESVLRTAPPLLEWIPARMADWRDRTVFPMKAAEVVRIELRRPEGTVRLARSTSSEWRLQHPVAARVDPGFPESFLREVSGWRVIEEMPEGEDLGRYGFDVSGLELSLDGGGQEPGERVLRLGQPVPEQPDRVYAVRSDKPTRVFTVSTQAVASLRTPLSAIRDPRLTRVPADKVTYLKMEWDGRTLEFRKESDQWRMGEPWNVDADREQVEMILSAWADARVAGFLDPPVAAPWTGGWEGARGGILMRFGSEPGQETRIAIHPEIQTNGQWVARVDEDSSLASLAPELPETLSLDPLVYRDLTVLRIPREDIRSLQQTTGGRMVKVSASTNGVWSAEGGAVLTSDALDGILAVLADLRALAWIRRAPQDLSAFGLDEPESRLTLSLDSREGLILELWLGRESGGGRYAMIRGREDVFLLPGPICRGLMSPVASMPGGGAGPGPE